MGKRNKIIFRKEKIPSILDSYSLRVKNKEYERIPYEIWKQLKYASKWEVEYSYETPKWFEIIVDNRWSYFYNNEIAGFCDFLLDYLEEKEIAKNIMPTDYNNKINWNYETFCSSLDSHCTAVDASTNTIGELATYVSNIDIDAGKAYTRGNTTTLTTTTPCNNCNIKSLAETILHDRAKEICKEIKEDEKLFKEHYGKLFKEHYEEKKGNENMKGFNFEFGTCEKDNVKMSMYGLAVQNASGSWVSYDTKTKSVVNVDILNFDCGKYMFKMPVAMKDIKVGDVVIHNRKPMFVTSIQDGLTAIDVVAGEEKKILLTKNMFGFNFATKVVSLFNMGAVNATADSPFGNMLPLFLLGNENKGDNDAMLMYMMMQGSGAFDMSNPMMLYFMLSKDGKSNDWMLPMMMMNMQAGKNECHCDKHDE